jgi:hypothetical protein
LGLRYLLTITAATLGLLSGSAMAAGGGPIMPLSEVQPGMNCTGETVIQGTTISSFNVHVIDIVEDSNETRILVSVSGPAVAATGVAEGMSGSPVYCQDPSGAMANIGAISAGIGQYGNTVALVTPIQEMLGEPVFPPSSAPRLSVPTQPLVGPLTVGGLSPALFSVLQRAGQRAGRTIVASPPAASGPSFPVQTLVPGASVATDYSDGTVTTGAVGTVTYTSGSTVYAFGHELDGAGRRSLLLDDAYVYYVVGDPNPDDSPASYKLAAPGHELGTLSSDTPNAVIGEVGSLPPLVPIQVTAHDTDTGQTISEPTEVADEASVGEPLGASMLDTVAPVAVGQAAIDVYNGPPSESGRMCLSITISESRQPLGFCNRYVGIGAAGDMGAIPPELSTGVAADTAAAFGILDQVQFAQLHVTRVQATISAQRGLAEGAIVGASAPRRVRPGTSVLVGLRVRLYRGSVETVRFRLRIPRRAHGRVLARIHGPTFSPSQSGSAAAALLGEALGVSLGVGSSGGPPPPSIAAVRQQIAAIGVYNGLKVSFNGHAAQPAYDDPALLISGRTTLAFQVS